MKKIFLITLTLGLTMGAIAQDFNYTVGDKTNKKAYEPELVQLVEGVQDGQLLVVEPVLGAVGGPGINRVKAIKVRLCDMEWNDVQSVTLDDTKGDVIMETFRTGNTLHVIVSSNRKGLLRLRHVALDAQSLAIVTDEVLYSATLDKGDEGYAWTANSPNGQFHGAVCVEWTKKGEPKGVALMYDGTMNKLWEREMGFPDVSNVVVTNNGLLSTLRLGTVDGNKNLTAFRINLVGAEGEKHGDFVLDADVSHAALLNCSDGSVLAVALEGKGGYSAIRVGPIGERTYSGLWGLVFDLNTDQIRVANRHPFTDEEIRTFINAAPGDILMGHEVDFLRMVDYCTTPQGGAVLYQRAWHEETRNVRTGMTSNETVYSKGILLVQADMNGTLTVSRIPQNNQNAGWPKVGADVFAHGGKVFVVTNESKEESDEYTPDRPAKRSNSLIMANAALAAYWFTPDGRGAKKVIEKEHKAILTTPLVAGEGGRFHFLTISSLQPHISRITIPADL